MQALAHHFEGFLEDLSRPYHLLQVGTISGGRGRFGDSVFLISRMPYARYDLETSQVLVVARYIMLKSFKGFRSHILLGHTIGHIQGFRRVVPV